MLSVLRDDDRYVFALRQGTFLLPKIFRNGSNTIMFALFLGATTCVRTLNDLSADLKSKDKLDLTVAHFACAGGSFDVCRELDNLDVDFSVGSKCGSPAKSACEYGRDELLMWLWTRGAILGDPQVGWSAKRGSDPDVLCAAALNGHWKVIRILVESIGIKFKSKLGVKGESAIASACRNGRDEALDVMFELGADVNPSALVEAIRSGSFKCVEKVLKRKVEVNAKAIELAAACGHADVLRLLLRHSSGDVGDSWLIAWLDGFEAGLRLLEAAGAIREWTASGVARLMRQPERAVELAGIVLLTPAAVAFPEWGASAELRQVIARVVREGTIPGAVTRALVERDRRCDACPFKSCSQSDLATFAIPAGVTRIGGCAFYDCSGLTKVKIPAGVAQISDWAFGECSNLAQIELPAGVTHFGSSSFRLCSALTKIEIPAAVTHIGEHAFSGCSGLTEVEIPIGVTQVSPHAFYDCSGLTTVVIPAGVTQIGDRHSVAVRA
jgi:ankyrin repeat protein